MEVLSPNNHGNELERQKTVEYIWKENVIINKTWKPCAHQLSMGKVKSQALDCIYSSQDKKSGIFLCYVMLSPDHIEYMVYPPTTIC